MATKDKDTLRPAVPVEPTKRDRVIAQRQKAAAQGDSIQSIANKNNIPEEDLLAANPGVVTVRPGQVVNIPPTGGGYMYSPPPVTNPFAGSQAYAGVKVQGSQQPNLGNYNSPYNGFQTPTTNGFQATQTQPTIRSAQANYRPPQQTQTQANFQTPATNGFSAPAGYTNLTPSQSQNIPSTNPALQPPAPSTPPAPMIPLDDKGNPIPYTGNPNDPNTKKWKDYWNASAEAGVDLAGRTSAPKVMTREQIWEMKAAQRRRQMLEQPNYSGGFQYDILSPLVRNITWGIRG